MTRPLHLLAVLALGITASTASAQPLGQPVKPKKFSDLADVTLIVKPEKAKPGETVKVELTITPKNGGWTYPFEPGNGQKSRNEWDPPKSDMLIFPAKLADPAPKPKPGTNEVYYPDPVTWEFLIKVSDQAKPGPTNITLGTTGFLACYKFGGDEGCIPSRRSEVPTAKFEILDPNGARAPVVPPGPPPGPEPKKEQPQVEKGAASTPKAAESSLKVAKSIETYEADLTEIQKSITVRDEDAGGTKPESGLGAFLLTAAAWGLISLVTPCVFPMIPITVSIFLKQAHGSLGQRLKLAGVYCGTIIVVLGASAFALLKFMAWLSAAPVTNILLGALFLILALSLFGMYELTLPNFLLRRLQTKQQKGGVTGMIFGALAFTVISFTCVAPFLGGFAGIAAANSASGDLISVPTMREILGGLVFATAFAAPFFILALIPGLLKALPKSGGWLDSVKVVMGFLEIAAALKFFRTAEIRLLPTPAYFTYDLVLAGWVALSVACGLYLLNVYRLPNDEEKPNIGVMRLLFGSLFLGLALYLFPATFKGADGKPQRPSGAVYSWVEAFLLPETDRDAGWRTDLKETIEKSRKSGKPVFIDFTGETCTNCKYNEQSVFPRPDIYNLLNQFERVQLYTDEVPAAAFEIDPGKSSRKDEANANREFQNALYGDISLPMYAVLVPLPDGKYRLIAKYREAKINSPTEFAQFLRDCLEKAKK